MALTNRKLPFLTLSTTKRLSALTYLVIWILLVIAYASGRFANFAANVIGIPNKADVQSGLSVPELLAAALFVTVFVDVSLRLTLSGIRNRVRRDLYGVMARIAVANIFCGAFIILTIEGYRIRNTFALFGSIPALFWPAELFKHWIMPANPLLSLFALALVIVITKAYAIGNLKRRLLVGGTILVFVPAILVNVLIWVLAASYLLVSSLVPPTENTGLEQADARCSASSGKVSASVVLRQSDRDFIAIDPHSFVIRFHVPQVGKDGELIRDVGKVSDGQPPLILSRSKPLPVTALVTLDPETTKQTDLPPTFDCDWVAEENAMDDSGFSRVDTWQSNDTN